jgi:integrase
LWEVLGSGWGVAIYRVSKILGHKDINMTYNVYGHLLQEEQAETLRLCEIGGRC